jgi:DNA-binding MarR family transcriptional regulator
MVDKKKSAKKDEGVMSKEEEIGYHKGALQTLINERNELIKMAQVTEQIMQAHIKRLEEMGIKLDMKR